MAVGNLGGGDSSRQQEAQPGSRVLSPFHPLIRSLPRAQAQQVVGGSSLGGGQS